jgi:AcrR family transcriptional regulator
MSNADASPEPGTPYDPCLPILPRSRQGARPTALTRYGQRVRRAEILAVIRRLLVEGGLDGVTVRRIAEASGYAVQTIYNLAGPREQSISEAINEYSVHVIRGAGLRPENPNAIIEIIDHWLRAIETVPEFCRQVNLIFFTDQRAIYYRFRDHQVTGMRNLLARQQKLGIVKPGINIHELAEQMVLFSSALSVEWSDRPFPLAQLHDRLCAGYESLMADKLTPPHRLVLTPWPPIIRHPRESGDPERRM